MWSTMRFFIWIGLVAKGGFSWLLDEEEFLQLTSQKKPVMVNFFKPGCPHSEALFKQWRGLKKKVKNELHIAEIDITDESHLSQMFDFQTTPTIAVFEEGRMYEYKGVRHAKELVRFCKNKTFRRSPHQKISPYNDPFIWIPVTVSYLLLERAPLVMDFDETILPLFFFLGIIAGFFSTLFLHALVFWNRCERTLLRDILTLGMIQRKLFSAFFEGKKILLEEKKYYIDDYGYDRRTGVQVRDVSFIRKMVLKFFPTQKLGENRRENYFLPKLGGNHVRDNLLGNVPDSDSSSLPRKIIAGFLEEGLVMTLSRNFFCKCEKCQNASQKMASDKFICNVALAKEGADLMGVKKQELLASGRSLDEWPRCKSNPHYVKRSSRNMISENMNTTSTTGSSTFSSYFSWNNLLCRKRAVSVRDDHAIWQRLVRLYHGRIMEMKIAALEKLDMEDNDINVSGNIAYETNVLSYETLTEDIFSDTEINEAVVAVLEDIKSFEEDKKDATEQCINKYFGISEDVRQKMNTKNTCYTTSTNISSSITSTTNMENVDFSTKEIFGGKNYGIDEQINICQDSSHLVNKTRVARKRIVTIPGNLVQENSEPGCTSSTGDSSDPQKYLENVDFSTKKIFGGKTSPSRRVTTHNDTKSLLVTREKNQNDLHDIDSRHCFKKNHKFSILEGEKIPKSQCVAKSMPLNKMCKNVLFDNSNALNIEEEVKCFSASMPLNKVNKNHVSIDNSSKDYASKLYALADKNCDYSSNSIKINAARLVNSRGNCASQKRCSSISVRSSNASIASIGSDFVAEASFGLGEEYPGKEGTN